MRLAALAVAGVARIDGRLAGDRADAAALVRITSPLGRTGATGVVRIVAQVEADACRRGRRVRFFVDNVLLGGSAEGSAVGGRVGRRQPVRAARDQRRGLRTRSAAPRAMSCS